MWDCKRSSAHSWPCEPPSMDSEQGQLARTSGGEEGSPLWVLSTFAVDQPIFAELNSTSSAVTDPNACVVLLKPRHLAETQTVQEKTWFLQTTKQGLERD